jgi:hypothetical protein
LLEKIVRNTKELARQKSAALHSGGFTTGGGQVLMQTIDTSSETSTFVPHPSIRVGVLGSISATGFPVITELTTELTLNLKTDPAYF